MKQQASRIGRPARLAAAGAALALAGCGGNAGNGEAAAEGAPGYLRAHTIQQLMANAVQPTADQYWQAVQYISDETGNHDIRPETDADWLATRTAAANLTEYGNLLMTPLYAEGRGRDWLDFSRGMVEIGIQAEQAAIDRDPDAVFEVGGTLYNVCRGCHQLYPPAEGPVEIAPGDTAPETTADEAVRPTAGVSLDEYQEQAAP